MRIEDFNSTNDFIKNVEAKLERMVDVALAMNGHTKEDIDNFIIHNLDIEWYDQLEFQYSVEWEYAGEVEFPANSEPVLIKKYSALQGKYFDYSDYTFSYEEIVRPYLFYKNVANAIKDDKNGAGKVRRERELLYKQQRYEQYLKLKEEFGE